MTEARNVGDAYKAAMIDEWRSYVTAGRTAQAEHVAEMLRVEYDYDVRGGSRKKKPEEAKEQAVVPAPAENTAAAKPAEAVVEAKQEERKPAPRTAAKKTAPARPQTGSK